MQRFYVNISRFTAASNEGGRSVVLGPSQYPAYVSTGVIHRLPEPRADRVLIVDRDVYERLTDERKQVGDVITHRQFLQVRTAESPTTRRMRLLKVVSGSTAIRSESPTGWKLYSSEPGKSATGLTGGPNDGVLTPEQQGAWNQRQIETANRVREHWQKGESVTTYPMVAMPTGFGKSRVVHQLIEHVSGKTLVVAGTKNILLDQNAENLDLLCPTLIGVADYSFLPDDGAKVTLGIWQSLQRYASDRNTSSFEVAVIDEVHNTGTVSRLQVLRRLKADKIVGLTATAYRSSGKYRAPEDYGFTIVDSIPLPDCIYQRWLSPMCGLCIDTGIKLSADVVDGGKFDRRALRRELAKHPDLFPSIARDLATRFLPEGLKTIIIVNRIQQAVEIARELEKHDVKVGLAINQSASKQWCKEFVTLDAIERYKLPHDDPKAIQVLISPQVIGEGFDAPATELVVWAAPTLSALRYTQAVGRGARRCVGKRYCLIVDYVYMIEDYGYSYNFAQFFRREDIQQLEGEVMYVGPDDIGRMLNLPQRYTEGGRLVPLVDLTREIFPPASDWFNVSQLSDLLGKTDKWVSSRLTPYENRSELRRNTYGPISTHYPPEVIDVLIPLAAITAAGDWLTAAQIANELKETNSWVGQRLVLFQSQGEIRVASNDHETLHYPLTVLEELRILSRESKESGEYLNVYQICQRLKRSEHWVSKHLAPHAHLMEHRRCESGRSVPHYPPSVVETLREEAESIPPAGNWLTAKQIEPLVGKSNKWVQTRLEPYLAESELRLTTNNDSRRHYPPYVVEELRLQR